MEGMLHLKVLRSPYKRDSALAVPGEIDRIESIWKETSDVMFGSYGIDQCLDLVEEALKSGRGLPKPEGDAWLEGTGVAMAMLESGPPTEHRSGAEMRLLADGGYRLAAGSTEMGNGSATSHRQIAASVLNTRASNITIIIGNTDETPYDTGTFANTGTVVAGQAVEKAARAPRQASRLCGPAFRLRRERLQPAGRLHHLRQPESSAD